MKNRALKNSFTFAFRGIGQAMKTETNMKRHVVIGLMALLLAFVLGFSLIEWSVLVLTITSVLVAELLNTAVEYSIDMTCGDQYNEIAKYAKDIAAGATLLAAIGAVVIGLMLYGPKLLELI